MIGKTSIGKSFGGCIRYCLKDKLDKKQQLTFVNRAEVLEYNLCFGTNMNLPGSSTRSGNLTKGYANR